MRHQNYEIFKVLVIGGLIWLIIIVVFYPKPDEIQNIETQLREGKYFNVSKRMYEEMSFSKREKTFFKMKSNQEEWMTLEIQKAIKLNKELINLETDDENFYSDASDVNGNVKMKKKKLKKVAEQPIVQFPSPPPNIFGNDSIGEMGEAVIMPSDLSPEIKKIIDEGWVKNAFNQYLSDLISVRRSIPDKREDYCQQLFYSDDLPATSVIIIFYNEAWSTLLR